MLSTLYIRESVTSGYIGVRPRLRSYLDAPNSRLEIRPVVIDDRNAPVAQVSRLARMKRYQWFFYCDVAPTDKRQNRQAVYLSETSSVSLALYDKDKDRNAGNYSSSVNIILTRLYVNLNIPVKYITSFHTTSFLSRGRMFDEWKRLFIGARLSQQKIPGEGDAAAIT